MNRFNTKIICGLLCAMLIGLGLAWSFTIARADSSATAPTAASAITAETATSQPIAAATSPAIGAAMGPAATQANVRDIMPIPMRSSGTFVRAPLMTRPFMILLTRSMFVRGHIAEASHVGVPVIPRQSNEPSLIRAETGLVFNGVTITNTTIDALVEDTATGRVLTVHPGDAVARGKVGKITMDSLQYIRNGTTTSIDIGQNFTGNAGDISSSPATSQPSGSGVSPQDMLEKLRQKRLQELGGK